MTFSAGQRILASQLQALEDHFQVTAFTPTWTNVTPGTSAVNEGYYATVNDAVFWWFRLQFGTSPAISGTAQLALPVNALTGGGTALQATLGSWIFRDTSATYHYSGALGVYSSAGTSASFNGAWDGTAPRTRITTSVPFAVAVDDVLSGSGVYLKA